MHLSFHPLFVLYLRIWETSSVVWGLSSNSLKPAEDKWTGEWKTLVNWCTNIYLEVDWAKLISSHHLSLTWANPHYWTPAGPGQWRLCLVGSSWRKLNPPQLLWRKAACLGLQKGTAWVRLPQCAAFDSGLQTAMRWCEEMNCRGPQVKVLLWPLMRRCYWGSDVGELSSVLVFFGKSPPWLECRRQNRLQKKTRDES